MHVARHGAHRADFVVQAHRFKRRVAPGAQHDAAPAVAVVVADFPAFAHHHGRRGAVVEAVAAEVGDGAGGGEGAALEIFALIERDLRGRRQWPRQRRVAVVVDAGVAVDDARRGDAVVQTHVGERGVFTRAQHHAAAPEAGALAKLPAVADDHHGRGAVVEAVAVEPVDFLVRTYGPAAKVRVFVEGGLGGRLGAEGHAGHGQQGA